MLRKISCLFFIFILSQGVLYSQSILSQITAVDSLKNDSVALYSLERIQQKNTLKIEFQLELNRRVIERLNSLQRYDKAVALSNKSVVLANKNKLDSLEAVFNKQLGVSYYYLDRKRVAATYFEKAAEIAQKNNLWELEANSYNNIGGALTDVQEYKQAEPYLLKSIEIMKAHGRENSTAVLRTYRVLARFYSENGQKEKAEPLYLIVIEKCKENKDTTLLCDNLLFYSDILAKRGEVDKAIGMSSEALAFIRKQNNSQTLFAALDIHGTNLLAAGRHKEAYDLSQESNYLMRKIFANNLEQEVSEVEVKYKTAQIKQEKELAELKTKKQKQTYLLSLIVILVIVIVSIYIWNQKKNINQKIRIAKELAEAEKLRFKDVIEAEEKERSRIAQELHDGLGQLLSAARINVANLEDAVTEESKEDLDRSLKIIDEACVEVRNISHNMMPSALIRLGLIPAINELVSNVNSAKGVKIDFTTNVDASLGKSLDITIYRVVQEVLNNMVKHAKANLISMSIEKNNTDLQIIMRDNGVGFNADELDKSKGIGWKNIFSRVSMLDGSIKLESELKKGTVVFINLKLKNG